MGRPDLFPIYLSELEQAKYQLDQAQKSSNAAEDPIERFRWSLDIEIRKALIRLYDGLIKLVHEPE
jgi:hypothetical protein